MTDVHEVGAYERLLANVTWKVKYFAAARGTELEFDDLFQEARMTYFRAVEKFDPDIGVQFSTYLYRSVRNNLSRIAKKAIGENFSTSSMDEQMSEDGRCLHDELPGDGEDMTARLDRLEQEARNFARLSENAQKVIAVLDSPSPELRRELLRMQAFRAHCKANKMAAADRVMNVETVCAALGYDRLTIKSIKREFKMIMEEVYG